MTDRVLARLRDEVDPMVADLEALVGVETPSEDLAAVRRGCDAVAALTQRRLGIRPTVVEVEGRPHLLLAGGDPRVLLIGHLDTVWPLGTTSRWPFSCDGTTATGPGIFDMKAGLVQGLYALADGIDLDAVTLLVTTDEEVGSPTSRRLVEQHARGVDAALVLEPGLDGALKTARKGVSLYRVVVTGRAAHAGLNPDEGVNALLELARQLPAVAALADPEAGTTVNPTRAMAGTTINTIPAGAEADVDVRAWTAVEQQRVDDAMRRLVPTDPAAGLAVDGGINRPPLEVAASGELFRRAASIADALGIGPLHQAAVGGGSDGNFSAAAGTPTLDGLGPVGAGAHAEGEHVVVAAMPERAALVHHLLADLLGDRKPSVGHQPPVAQLPVDRHQ